MNGVPRIRDLPLWSGSGCSKGSGIDSILQLFICIVWSLLVGALEFAVQAFDLGVQECRFVGDGAVYACEFIEITLDQPQLTPIAWWVFILLLNACIVIPGLYILQPVRLIRYALSRGKTPRELYRGE